jgi:hypothetical protein
MNSDSGLDKNIGQTISVFIGFINNPLRVPTFHWFDLIHAVGCVTKTTTADVHSNATVVSMSYNYFLQRIPIIV